MIRDSINNVVSSIVKQKKIFSKREEDQDEVFSQEYDEIDARDLETIYQRYMDELKAHTQVFSRTFSKVECTSRLYVPVITN